MRDENGVFTRVRVFHPSGGEMMTKQADKDAADINTIMNKYVETGVYPISTKTPYYGNFVGTPTFHEGLNRIASAQEDFDRLPARVRKHVDNDPGKFLDLVHDPERRDELEALGLVKAQIPVKPEPVVKPPETPAPPETPPAS